MAESASGPPGQVPWTGWPGPRSAPLLFAFTITRLRRGSQRSAESGQAHPVTPNGLANWVPKWQRPLFEHVLERLEGLGLHARGGRLRLDLHHLARLERV